VYTSFVTSGGGSRDGGIPEKAVAKFVGRGAGRLVGVCICACRRGPESDPLVMLECPLDWSHQESSREKC